MRQSTKTTRSLVVVAVIAIVIGSFFSQQFRAQAEAQPATMNYSLAGQPSIPPELEAKLAKRISLDLRDMDIVDVYKFLALKGDFNISISKESTGRITLYLKDVSIKDALDIISLANNQGYKVMGNNIIHVMPEIVYTGMFGKKFSDKREVKILYLKYAKPAYVLEALKNVKSDIGRIVIDEDSGGLVMVDTHEAIGQMQALIENIDHPLQTQVYDLQYALADDVANKLKAKLDNKAVGSVQADARSNRLIVQAFPDRLTEVDALVKALDKKTSAVRIEVRILKLILNPQYDFGIDWQVALSGSENSLLKNLAVRGAFPISSTISSDTTLGTVGKLTFGDISQNDFTVTLKALDQVAETKVLANPTLLVQNNKEARIHVGDKIAYVTTTTIGTGESQRVNEEIVYIDVGVQFKVTPTINDDGFVSMTIKPEISSQSGTLETPEGAEVPLINSTVVETTVLVKDGNTIIIGGLRQDEVKSTKKGFPFLKDLPLIGKIFSNEYDEKTKTEIVILLTPHITAGDENALDEQLVEAQAIKPDKKY